jgi:hypothetical protein
MQKPRQSRWLIAAVLLALGLIAAVMFRPRTGPAGSSAAVQPNPIPTAAAQPSGPQGPAPAASAPELTSTSGPSDWAMEGYNPARTRSIAAALALPLTQQHELALAGDTGAGSPLTISRGVMLVDTPHLLRALDLQSGTERWSLPLEGVYVSPAVAGSTVFVRSEADNKGQLLALDIGTGKQRWAFRQKRISSAATSYFGGHLTSPVVVGGTIFLGAGKEVYALDAATGAQRWMFAAQDYISSSATLADGRVFIADLKQLYALDEQTGNMIWSFPTTTSIYFSPVVAEQTVLLSNGDKLVALDTANAKQRWALSMPGEGLIPGAVQGTRAFVKSTKALYALDLASGKQLWQIHDLNYVSLPAVAGDSVFMVIGMGAGSMVAALDAATGQGTWKQPFASLATSAPIIAGQALYARTTDGRVIQFAR